MLGTNCGPTQARISGPASRNSAAASGITGKSDRRVPWMKMMRRCSGRSPAWLSTTTGNSTPFN